MPDRIAYFNGQYIQENEVKISIQDRGFLNGDAAFDVGRTFKRKPFRFEDHIERWFRSLRYMHIDIGMTPKQVYDVTLGVLKRNEQNLGLNDDYWVRWVGTPGEQRFRFPLNPTVLIYCTPIPFATFAEQYIKGIHVVIASNRAIPPECLDSKAKLYSRAHYALAEIEAKSVDPESYALLLDCDGHLAECTKNNIFLVSKGKLLTPKRDNILEGVSRGTVLELSKTLQIEAIEMDLCVYDLNNADEIFITATSFALLPVAKVNHQPLGKPIPGPITKRLLSAWNDLVGIDIVQQALSHL